MRRKKKVIGDLLWVETCETFSRLSERIALLHFGSHLFYKFHDNLSHGNLERFLIREIVFARCGLLPCFELVHILILRLRGAA